MPDRKILRFALLQNYAGHSEKLVDDMPEVARKGYHGVFLWAKIDEREKVRPLCERAASLGLKTALGTGYMKYQYKYLADHPEQRLVQAGGSLDQDGLTTTNWGCPFNEDFKARYFDFVVDGSPFSRADPRSAEGFAWECFERAADGICHFGEVDPDSEGEGFSVGRNGMLLGYPWPTDAAALTGPGGAAVESKTVDDALHGTITLSWEAPLEPETTYEVTLPVLYDSNGLPLLEADRTVRFTTLAPIE